MPAAVAPPEAGLLYVLTRPKPEHVHEYQEWYNTEHGPLRMQLDFMQNGYRYRSADGDPSLYMAMYDLYRVSGVEEPQYITMRSQRSAREVEVLDKKLDLVDRRLYTQVASRGVTKGPAPVVMVVEMLVPDELEAEVHQWYEEVCEAHISAGGAIIIGTGTHGRSPEDSRLAKDEKISARQRGRSASWLH